MKNQRGFTMVEGLITLVILVVAVVGFVYIFARLIGTAREGTENPIVPQLPAPHYNNTNNGGGNGNEPEEPLGI